MRRLRPLLPLLAIVALAAFFRLYRLDHVPPGLFGDEAANGVEATAILRGERFPIYIEEAGPAKWGSREALYHYAMAGVFAVFGGSPTTIRLTSALLGILTVALFFPLARRWLGPRAGFFAAGLFAVSRWHVTASRLGLRAILVPLFVVLVLLAFSALATSRRWRWALLLGVLTGLGFYTYPSYWAVPPALCLVGFAAYRAGSPSRRGLGLALCTALVAVAVAAPLLGYALRRPDYFFGRTANVLQIHASNGHADSLRDHVQGVLFSLHLRGDENPRHNIPLAPLLDPITGVLFLIGLYRLLRHFDRASPVHVALLAFLLLPLVPEALGDAAPHALRGLGALPAIFAICGLVFGLPEAARAALGRRAAGPPSRCSAWPPSRHGITTATSTAGRRTRPCTPPSTPGRWSSRATAPTSPRATTSTPRPRCTPFPSCASCAGTALARGTGSAARRRSRRPAGRGAIGYTSPTLPRCNGPSRACTRRPRSSVATRCGPACRAASTAYGATTWRPR